MAIQRDRPYDGFNFLVDFDGDPESPQAGFEVVGPIAMEIPVTEYRNGNSKENAVIKLPGLAKVSDVSFKRGLIGSLDLYRWIDDVRNGNPNAVRNVRVRLQNEDRSAVVQTWRLLRARIVKFSTGPLNAKGSDIAMEEMVLAYERLEIE